MILGKMRESRVNIGNASEWAVIFEFQDEQVMFENGDRSKDFASRW